MALLQGKPRRILLAGIIPLFVILGPRINETFLGLQMGALWGLVTYGFFSRCIGSPGEWNRRWNAIWRGESYYRRDMVLYSIAFALNIVMYYERDYLENTIHGAFFLFLCLLTGTCVGLTLDWWLVSTRHASSDNVAGRFRYTFLTALVAAMLTAAVGSILNRYLTSPKTATDRYQVLATRKITIYSRGRSGWSRVARKFYLTDIVVGGKHEWLDVGLRPVEVGDTLLVTTRRGFFGFASVEEIEIVNDAALAKTIERLGGKFVTDEEGPIVLHLVTVDLRGTQVSDAQLKDFQGLRSLQTLNLDYTQITDAGVSELTQLQSLQTLGLRKTQITDKSLKHLRELTSLRTLNLGETAITDAGLRELKELKNLKLLILIGTRVSDVGLIELKYLPSLQHLDLIGTQVTDAGLKELSALPNVQYLRLDRTRVSNRGLKELMALKNLETLGLEHTRVTKAGVDELKAMRPELNVIYEVGH